MAKIDYKNEFKSLYKAPDEPTLVEVPPLSYLMIDGQGDPNTAPVYSESVGTLYKLAYAIRFLMRDEHDLDFGVMPLEGLWWVEDLDEFSYSDKKQLVLDHADHAALSRHRGNRGSRPGEGCQEA